MKARFALNFSWCLALALLIGTASSSLFGETATQADDGSPFAQAEAALAEARQKELAACEEYDSYQMAHAAAREIARSERARAANALQRAQAADEAFRLALAASKPESELAALKQTAHDRLATLRAATGRMLADSRAASKASEDVLAGDAAIRACQTAARKLERALLEAKAVKAEQTQAADVAEARRAVHGLELQLGIEAQQWPNMRRLWALEYAEQARESVKLATALAASESDSVEKRKLEDFAAEQAVRQAEAEKVAAQGEQDMVAATPRLYPLRAAASGGLKLLSPDEWDYAKARHLLVRAGFGGTPQEVEKLHRLGLYKAVDFLVEYYRQPGASIAFDPVPPQRMDPVIDRLTVRTMSSRVAAAQKSVERGQVAGLRQAWLRRMVESPRPLQEKLALFWHGHFASQESVVQNSYTMFRQNQLFREHASGNFGALLYGIVHDPAMLRYLDNNQNVKGQPNENLGREILELFSMGVDQGYSEHDIIEAARALTGYNYDDTTGGFRYFRDQHDSTEKVIFGQKGPWTGDDLVRLILQQPHTSRFIARRLFEYFAYPDPDEAVLEPLATVLRVSQYDLEPLLKNLFMSEEFYSSRAMGNQIKSPVELIVGLLRDLGVKQVANYGGIDSAVRQMGMELLEPPDVKGWRYGRSWINSQRLFVRYNAVSNLVRSVGHSGKKPGADVLALVQSGGCTNSTEAVDYLIKACLIRPLADEKRQELIRYLGDLPPCQEWSNKRDELNLRFQGLLVLLLSIPEYQMT
jgi:uncharacterized protein (DUF1800 family)